MTSKIKVNIIVMVVGAAICALGIYLPVKLGLLVQEVSSLVMFIALYNISSIVKDKRKALGNALKYLSVFFLVAIVVSLINTLRILLTS